MKKLIVGTLAILLLVALTLAIAPIVKAAQGPPRPPIPPSQFELPLPINPGSSIGISVRDLSADEITKAKLREPGGALVSAVSDASPASKAGLKSEDIVVEFDGERVRSARHLTRLVQETPAGRTVKAAVVRGGSRQTLDITPEARDRIAFNGLPEIQREVERGLRNLPRNFSLQIDPPDGAPFRRGRLGAGLTPMSDQLASYFGVKQGVLVSTVDENSPAAQAGLKAGDIITAVNGRTVETPADVADVIRDTQAGASVEMSVTREHKELTLKATLPERPDRRRNALPV